MARIARAVAVGFPHHVVHRGNNKAAIFFDNNDYQVYLSFLKEYVDKWSLIVLAYCLMTNHIHLLIKPQTEISLSKAMQGVSQRFATHINKTYHKSGRLWESRYFSCIVGYDEYLWTVTRYIEQNPVRAGMVIHEEDYPYSSAKAHLLGIEDDLLGKALFTESETENYANFIKENLPEDRIKQLRSSTKSGRPFGNEAFIGMLESTMNRKLSTVRPKRRPEPPRKF